MNNEPAVRPETAERVRAAAAALSYSVNPAARLLGGGRTHSLGMLVVARSQWQWTADLVAGALNRSRERGYGLVPHVLGVGDLGERETILALAARRVVDGLLITTPWAEDQDLLAELDRRGMPIALVPAPIGSEHPSVRADEEGAAYALTRHLLDHGHKRIAVLAGQRTLDLTRQRLRGFQRAMRETGVTVEPGLQILADYTFRTGVLESRKLLARESPPTAVFAFSDVLAAGALRAAHEIGLTLPRDLSVVGVGDLAVSQMVWPALTTAAVPSTEMAAAAVDLLVEAIEGGPSPDREVVFATRLIVRGSSGPAAGQAVAFQPLSPDPAGC